MPFYSTSMRNSISAFTVSSALAVLRILMMMVKLLDRYLEVSELFCKCHEYLHLLTADLRLSVPARKGFSPDQTTRRRIAKFFPVLATGRRRQAIRIHD